MLDIQLPEIVRQWCNDVLVWVGFGTLVGLLSKAIMPGRDPGGPVATVLMGIGGTIIGCGTLMYFWGHPVTPITPIGFLVGTAGAFLILFFFRLLSGRIIREEGESRHPHYRRHRAHGVTVVRED